MENLIKRRRINILDFIDYEKWLEDLQLKGWKLSEIKHNNKHIFIKDTPKKVRYCLDYCEDYVEYPAEYYEKVYSDFGWNLVYKNKDIFLWQMDYQDKRPDAFNNMEEIDRRNKEFIKKSNPMLIICTILILLVSSIYIPRFLISKSIYDILFLLAWYILAVIKIIPIIAGYKYYFKNKEVIERKNINL